MEIEIDSKKNNPLLNRTEIYFTIKHEGEGTPNREIIRSELADKLNVKKENIIVNTVHSSFGIQEISCYAKVYSSSEKSKNLERDYLLKRNKLIDAKEKKTKADEKPATAPTVKGAEEKATEEKPMDSTEEVKEEQTVEEPAEKPEMSAEPKDQPVEKPETTEEPPKEEGAEEPQKETPSESETPKEETKQETPEAEKPKEAVKKPDEKPQEETVSEKSEQPAKEKKE